jgi:hypothetical protein
MEHIISFSDNYHAVQPAGLPFAKTAITRLIDWLAQPFVTSKPQIATPGSKGCCPPNKHCSRHGVNCPRFSPLTHV